MTVVSGKVRVNRPFFFTDKHGQRVDFPSFGHAQADLGDDELRRYHAAVKDLHIEDLPVKAEPSDDAPKKTSKKK